MALRAFTAAGCAKNDREKTAIFAGKIFPGWKKFAVGKFPTSPASGQLFKPARAAT